jgi:hypothetical protein
LSSARRGSGGVVITKVRMKCWTSSRYARRVRQTPGTDQTLADQPLEHQAAWSTKVA